MPLRSLLAVALAALTLGGCDATNTTPDRAESVPLELFNRVTIRLTATGQPARSVTLLQSGTSVADTLRLTATAAATPTSPAVNRVYTGSIELRESPAQAQFLREAESRLVVYSASGAGSTVRVTDRESLYTETNLNDGDYAVGRTFALTLQAGQATTGLLTVRMTRFEGAPKTSGTAPGPIEEFVLSVPYVVTLP